MEQYILCYMQVVDSFSPFPSLASILVDLSTPVGLFLSDLAFSHPTFPVGLDQRLQIVSFQPLSNMKCIVSTVSQRWLKVRQLDVSGAAWDSATGGIIFWWAVVKNIRLDKSSPVLGSVAGCLFRACASYPRDATLWMTSMFLPFFLLLSIPIISGLSLC